MLLTTIFLFLFHYFHYSFRFDHFCVNALSWKCREIISIWLFSVAFLLLFMKYTNIVILFHLFIESYRFYHAIEIVEHFFYDSIFSFSLFVTCFLWSTFMHVCMWVCVCASIYGQLHFNWKLIFDFLKLNKTKKGK